MLPSPYMLYFEEEKWKLRRTSIWVREIQTDNLLTKLPCPFNLIEIIWICVDKCARACFCKPEEPSENDRIKSRNIRHKAYFDLLEVLLERYLIQEEDDLQDDITIEDLTNFRNEMKFEIETTGNR